jgi:hypothetical protein
LAYPNADNVILSQYENDSICDTWEVLADAVFAGGSQKLLKSGWQAIGIEKSNWAKNIAPNMIINDNNSPSFCYFRSKLKTLIC